MNFNDYFSQKAEDYLIYRPCYPQELFEYLSSLLQEHETAWDCGTGNGQAALGLVEYFSLVYGSDASSQQIAHAVPHERIEYFVSLAESTPLGDESINLITVGQAFHWFDAVGFYAEVNRVLKPGGILAIWCYGLFDVLDAAPPLKTAIANFYSQIDAFWPPERQLVKDGYSTIAFPFQEITAPQFWMRVEWDVNSLIGYLQTWSATQRYIATLKEEAMLKLLENIVKYWDSQKINKTISWPIHLRVGTKKFV